MTESWYFTREISGIGGCLHLILISRLVRLRLFHCFNFSALAASNASFFKFVHHLFSRTGKTTESLYFTREISGIGGSLHLILISRLVRLRLFYCFNFYALSASNASAVTLITLCRIMAFTESCDMDNEASSPLAS